MAPLMPTANTISASTRYYSNLTVLQRHDPSIDTILDVFPHVCVYAHDGVRWEKAGYEGVLLLFERKPGHYPPYGFYIMNRMSVGDYIQFIYPEDFFSQMGKYLYIYHFPEFTEKRMRYVKETHGKNCGMEAYVPTPEWLAVPGGKKGTASSIGLWIENKEDGSEATSAGGREPMYSVLIRVHELTKKGERYPDEHRYGPDKPAPNMTGKPLIAPQHISDASDDSTDDQIDNPELDQLLAKLGPAQKTSEPTTKVKTTVTKTTTEILTKPQTTKQTNLAVQSLFQQPTRDVLPTPKSGSDLLAALFETNSTVAATLMAPSNETVRPRSHTSTPSNEDSSAGSDIEPRVLTADVITSLLSNMHSNAYTSHPAAILDSPTSSNDAGSSSQQHTESDDDSLTYQSTNFHGAPSHSKDNTHANAPVRPAISSTSMHTTPTPSHTLSFFAPSAEVVDDIDDEDAIPEIDFNDTHLLESPNIKRKSKVQPPKQQPPVRPPLNSTPSLLDQLFMADAKELAYPESNATPSPESSPEVVHAKAAVPLANGNGNGATAASLMDQLRSAQTPPVQAPPSFAPAQRATPSHDMGVTAQALLDTFLGSKSSPIAKQNGLNGHVNGYGIGPRSHKYGINMPRARTKNELLRELMEKLQTDRAFGDHLWESYEHAVAGL